MLKFSEGSKAVNGKDEVIFLIAVINRGKHLMKRKRNLDFVWLLNPALHLIMTHIV